MIGSGFGMGYGEIEAEKGRWEKVLSIFPGYEGYRKKETLREIDKLLRDALYNDLRKSKELLQNHCRNLISNNKIDSDSSERTLMKLDATSEKIHHATYGYASEMSAIKVKEDKIKRLIEFDESLADNVKKIRECVDKLKNPDDDPKKLLVDVNEQTILLDEHFGHRKEFMLGLGRD